MGRSPRPRKHSAACMWSKPPTSTRPSATPPGSPALRPGRSRSGRSSTSPRCAADAAEVSTAAGSLHPDPRPANDAVARVFREEQGRAVASLIRVLGDFDLAEEAVQDAYISALEVWPQ